MVEFTEEEIEELKTNISQIKGRIPEHLAGWVWGTYNRINGSNEKQPCGCKSAAGLWGKACLLYTSPSPRDGLLSRMPSSA